VAAYIGAAPVAVPLLALPASEISDEAEATLEEKGEAAEETAAADEDTGEGVVAAVLVFIQEAAVATVPEEPEPEPEPGMAVMLPSALRYLELALETSSL
jgi:hypothetical protein